MIPPITNFNSAVHLSTWPQNNLILDFSLEALLSKGLAHEVLFRIGGAVRDDTDPDILFLEAYALFMLGQYQQAEKLFSRLSEDDVTNVAFILQCKIKQGQTELQEAFQALYPQIEEDPSLPFELELYIPHLHEGRFEEVLKWMRTINKGLFSYDLLLLKACLLYLTGSEQACIEALKSLSDTGSGNLGKNPFFSATPKARAWLEQFVRKNPFSDNVLGYLGRVFVLFNEHDLALVVYRNLSSRFAHDAFFLSVSALQDAFSSHPSSHWRNDFERAVREVSQTDRDKVMFNYAQAILYAQEWDKFLEITTELTHIPDVSFMRGEAFFKKSCFELSSQSYEKAIEEKKTEPSYWKGKGKAESELGNLEEAHRCFNECLQLDPYDPEAYRLRSRISYLKGPENYLQAKFDISQSSKIDSSTYSRLFLNAEKYIESRNFELALKEVNYSLFCTSDVKEFYYQKGFICFELGLFLEAEAAFKKYLQLNKTSVNDQAHLHYVLTLIQLQKHKKAQSYLDSRYIPSPSYKKKHAEIRLVAYLSEPDTTVIKLFEKFLAEWPKSPLQLSQLAEIHIQRKNYHAAHLYLSKSFQLESTARKTRLLSWLNLLLPSVEVIPPSLDEIEKRIRQAQLFQKAWKQFKGHHASKPGSPRDILLHHPEQVNIRTLERFYLKGIWQCSLTKPTEAMIQEEMRLIPKLLKSPLPGAIQAALHRLYLMVHLTHKHNAPYPALAKLYHDHLTPESLTLIDLEKLNHFFGINERIKLLSREKIQGKSCLFEGKVIQKSFLDNLRRFIIAKSRVQGGSEHQ